MSRADYLQWVDTHREDLTLTLPTSEVFGPTIQGEGSHAGRPCYFIRLGGCNLSCDWCDTPYSTGTHGIPLSTVPRHTITHIASHIPAGTLVILTGGEPLMHIKRPAFHALLHLLKSMGCEIHVETNGTLDPTPIAEHIDHFTVSPKLGVHMLNPNHTPHLPSWEHLADKTIFKWVIEQQEPNYHTAIQERLATSKAAGIPTNQVWFMPEGVEADQLQTHWAKVAQAAADNNANATHRLHTLAWGNKKGH